jgi:hypothetical protein
LRRKPQPEQSEYDSRENEADAEDNKHGPIQKAGPRFNGRLDLVTLLVPHARLLSSFPNNAPSPERFQRPARA